MATDTKPSNGTLDLKTACQIAIVALAPAAKAGKRTQLVAKYEQEWADELERRRKAAEAEAKREKERKQREAEERKRKKQEALERKRQRDREYRARKRVEREKAKQLALLDNALRVEFADWIGHHPNAALFDWAVATSNVAQSIGLERSQTTEEGSR